MKPHDLIVNILEKLPVKSLVRFNSMRFSFIIVKLFDPSPRTAEEDVDSCAVFTLDSNPKACWKTIGVVPYKISAYSHSKYVNGAIYWFTDEIRHLNKSEVIIMFDLHSQKFEPIPHPNHCSDERRSNMQLVTLRECLCLVHQEPDLGEASE
ncbi:hypothetical protein V6N11_020869 [Hibiscus sabdariffa]|uniref:F-box associated beta-propeller type 1 domain-containing protein n=1 Tax=Hibiscus sabdariffa TaxID=183260 RepID=A0ABR2Q9P4_9ROSI